MAECRYTVTDALDGNRGYDFAANAAGYAGFGWGSRRPGSMGVLEWHMVAAPAIRRHMVDRQG